MLTIWGLVVVVMDNGEIKSSAEPCNFWQHVVRAGLTDVTPGNTHQVIQRSFMDASHYTSGLEEGSTKKVKH